MYNLRNRQAPLPVKWYRYGQGLAAAPFGALEQIAKNRIVKGAATIGGAYYATNKYMPRKEKRKYEVYNSFDKYRASKKSTMQFKRRRLNASSYIQVPHRNVGFTYKRKKSYKQPFSRRARGPQRGLYKRRRSRMSAMRRTRRVRKRSVRSFKKGHVQSISSKLLRLWQNTCLSAQKLVYAFNRNMEFKGTTNKRTFVALGLTANQGTTPGADHTLTDVNNFATAKHLLFGVGTPGTPLITDNTDKWYINNAIGVYNISNTGNENIRVKIWKCKCKGYDGNLDGALSRMSNYLGDAALFPNGTLATYDVNRRKVIVDDSPFATKAITRWGLDDIWSMKPVMTKRLGPNQGFKFKQQMSSNCSAMSYQKYHPVNAAALGTDYKYTAGSVMYIVEFQAIDPLHSVFPDVAITDTLRTGVPGGRLAIKGSYSGAICKATNLQTKFYNQTQSNPYEETAFGQLRIINDALAEAVNLA